MTSGGNNFIDFPENRLTNLLPGGLSFQFTKFKQPGLMASRYVMYVAYIVQPPRNASVFGGSTQNSGHFSPFVDQISLNQDAPAQERVQFTTSFPLDDIWFRSRDNRDQVVQLSDICREF